MSHDGALRPGDSFGLTADPAAYVPRLALESALTALQQTIATPPACAALVGEPGMGKTLLLRVLAERVEGAFESLYVPYPRLSPAELWAWMAAALGIAGSGDDRVAVLAHAQRARDDGTGLLLLVDDAGALPPETRSELIGTCRAPGVALVMAFSTDDGALLAKLPADVRRIDLGPPMTLPELRAYVRARLRRVDPAGIIGARLTAERMAELLEASGGVPARVHVLLDAWLRGRRVEAASPGAARPTPQPVARPPAPTLEDDDDLPSETPAASHRVERGPRPRRAPDSGRPSFFRRGRRRGGVRILPAVVLVLLLAGVWYATTQPATPPAVGPDVPANDVAAPPPEDFVAMPAEPELPALPALPAASEPPAAAQAPPAEAEPPAAPAAEIPAAEELAAAATAPPPEPAVEAAPPEPAPAPEPEPPARPDVAAAPPPAPRPEPERAPEPAPSPAVAPAPERPPVLALPAPPPRPGARLSVNAEPWAEIQLDGRSLGQTPLGEVPLAPGRHRVTATMPDGSIIERAVEARSGDVFLTFP